MTCLCRLQDYLSQIVQNGLTPTLLKALRKHQTLAQTSLNADVLYASLSHLSECKARLEKVQRLVDTGNLPAAVPASTQLTELLDTTPRPLAEAIITSDIWVRGFMMCLAV